jgi:hypothetical protein
MNAWTYLVFLITLTTSCAYTLEPDYERERRNRNFEPSSANGTDTGKSSDAKPSGSDEVKDTKEPEPEPEPSNLVSYDNSIQELLETNCTSCHSQGGTPPNLVGYAAASELAEPSIEIILEGRMPPNAPLYDDEIDLFETWIENGLPEADEDADIDDPIIVEEPADSSSLSFVQDIKPILAASCAVAGCHNATSPIAGYDFETFDGTAIGIEDGISTIELGEMPIGGRPKISAADLKTLQDWLDGGTPE